MVNSHFQALGEAIANTWARFDYDNEALPDIAIDALTASRTCDRLSGEEILRWAMSTPSLPQQTDLDSGFGEPPLTLYLHPKFYIEVLYWANGTTSIHQHGFSGAFAVLQGSSIQSRYTFEVRRRVNAHMLLGTLDLQDVKLLRRGDIEPIRSGAHLIHSVFHLDSPSATLVVRTHSDAEHQPQYNYFRPHLALNPMFRDATAVRRAQALRMLDATKSSQFDDMAATAIKSSDMYSVYALLACLKATAMGSKRFEHWITAARDRHGADIDTLRAVIEQGEREKALRMLRGRSSSPDHRFLLALLMNLSSRSDILSLIKSRFVDRDPTRLAAQWVAELSGTLPSDVDRRAANQVLLQYLIEGLPVSDVIHRVAEQYPAITLPRQQLMDHCAVMRSSPVFGPLFEATP